MANLRVGFRGHNTNFAGSQSSADRSACEERLEDADNLPDLDVLAQGIADGLLTRRGGVKIADAERAWVRDRASSSAQA